MSADPMMQAVDLAFEKLFLPVRRVSHSEMKFNALPEEKKRHNVRAWILARKDPAGWVQDALDLLSEEEVLDLFAAGDSAAIGDLVCRELMKYGPRVFEDER